MKSIKKLFSTPKKAILSGVCALGLIALLGVGTVYAASGIAESSSIGEENAKKFAFADAGVDPVSAEAVHAEFDFEMGMFVYDVEFTSGDIEYEYMINASDGSIVRRERETLKTASQSTVKNTETAQSENINVEAAKNGELENTAENIKSGNGRSAYIGADQAKSTALGHAGLNMDEVTFTKVKLENDDGADVYEIEFFKDSVEYEYTINALNGNIVEYESDWDD